MASGKWQKKDQVIKQPADKFSAACRLPLSAARRYARHIVIPEIGEAGQEKLLASSVLVIGAGGLGSAAIAYLAAAGVGRIGICEPDKVELSNLQRQVLFETADIGRDKIDAARDRVEEVNPSCKVELFRERIDKINARQIIQDFFYASICPHPNPPPQAGEGTIKQAGEGIVLDGSDNFATRFALADACAREKKPLVSAAISGFSGQLSTFKPYLGEPHPCYRCFVAEQPEREISCEQEGILGPLAGMFGSMQALEAIRELLGLGESLSGSLLIFDAFSMQMKKTTLPRDPGCAFCHARS